MVRLVLLLVLAIAVFWLLWTWFTPARRPTEDPALAVVRRVRELAWDHRDIEPTLAEALIDRVAQAEARGHAEPGILDELLELAWQHRETDTGLSLLVVDLIRSERRDLEG